MGRYLNPQHANDPMLTIAMGYNPLISKISSVNKFGRSINVDQHETDIWDVANQSSYPTAGLDDQDIWVAPTQARIHNVKSTDSDDDGDPVGDGARTIRVYGLTDWDTKETSEVITLNGTTDVATSNAYVIIHRMKVLTKGATAINVGTIYATAVTDDTITAQINPGEGQTQMAIYGIPSIQTACMTGFYASVLRAGLSTNERHVDIQVLFNPEPDSELLNFQTKHSTMAGTRASDPFLHTYLPYNGFNGPGIFKIQAIGSANNLDVSAGFDLILVEN
ncbi:MAG: hypothetical protein GY799_31605 [Desulfobulbaceae bacterium]|nr:hypothetical protein [Desulfobulbaceae bacterium]